MMHQNSCNAYSVSLDEGEIMPSSWSSTSNEYGAISEEMDDFVADDFESSFFHIGRQAQLANCWGAGDKKLSQQTLLLGIKGSPVPLVSLRSALSTDAWFILSLLSSAPFLSSLSYASTMEVLETARVDAYCKNDVVVLCWRRAITLCVI